MNYVADKIPGLVKEELTEANRTHPQFASLHEGYAVLKEEIEETDAALGDVVAEENALWAAVKADNLCEAHNAAWRLNNRAQHVAAEAIQVAAMAQKFCDRCLKGVVTDDKKA